MPLDMFVLIAAHLGFLQGYVVREGHIDLPRDFSLLSPLVFIDYVKNQSRRSKATNDLKKIQSDKQPTGQVSSKHQTANITQIEPSSLVIS